MHSTCAVNTRSTVNSNNNKCAGFQIYLGLSRSKLCTTHANSSQCRRRRGCGLYRRRRDKFKECSLLSIVCPNTFSSRFWIPACWPSELTPAPRQKVLWQQEWPSCKVLFTIFRAYVNNSIDQMLSVRFGNKPVNTTACLTQSTLRWVSKFCCQHCVCYNVFVWLNHQLTCFLTNVAKLAKQIFFLLYFCVNC